MLTRLQPIRVVIQHGRQGAPVQALAQLDDAGREAVAGLRQVLHGAARQPVLARDGVHRHLVAQVAQLQRRVEAAVHAGQRVVSGRAAG